MTTRRLTLIKDGYLRPKQGDTPLYEKTLYEDFHIVWGQYLEQVRPEDRGWERAKLEASKLRRQVLDLGYTLAVTERGAKKSPKVLNAKLVGSLFKAKMGSCFSVKKYSYRVDLLGEFKLEVRQQTANTQSSLFQWPKKLQKYDFRLCLDDLSNKQNLFVYSSEENDLLNLKRHFWGLRFDEDPALKAAKDLMQQVVLRSRVYASELIFKRGGQWTQDREIEVEMERTHNDDPGSMLSLNNFHFQSMRENSKGTSSHIQSRMSSDKNDGKSPRSREMTTGKALRVPQNTSHFDASTSYRQNIVVSDLMNTISPHDSDYNLQSLILPSESNRPQKYTENVSLTDIRNPHDSNNYLLHELRQEEELQQEDGMIGRGSEFESFKERQLRHRQVLSDRPNLFITVDSLWLDRELGWVSPNLVFHLLELNTKLTSSVANSIQDGGKNTAPKIISVNQAPMIASEEFTTGLREEMAGIEFKAQRQLQLSTKVSHDSENFLEVALCNKNSQSQVKALYTTQIPIKSIYKVSRMCCCLSLPFLVEGKACVLTLKPEIAIPSKKRTGELEMLPVNQAYYNKLSDRLKSKAEDVASSLQASNITEVLDSYINRVIREKRYEEALSIRDLSLPSAILLNLWLIISKKCKFFTDSDRSPQNPTRTQGQGNLDSSRVKAIYKSSIMRSLYLDNQVSAKKKARVKKNTMFEKLLRNLENLSSPDYSLVNQSFGIVERHKGEYFYSQENKRKVFEQFLLRVQGDYFNMSHSSSLGLTHLFFSTELRSLSRDFLVVSEFLAVSCPSLVTLLRKWIIHPALYFVEKIVNANLELFKEPGCQYYCNTLFLLSLRNKATGDRNFGWRFILTSTLFILEDLEKMCLEQNWLSLSHFDLKKLSSKILEMTQQKSYLKSLIKRCLDPPKSEKGTTILSFVTDKFLDSPKKSKLELINEVRSNKVYLAVIKEQFKLNAWVYDIVRTKIQLNTLVSIIKPLPLFKKRRIHFSLQDILLRGSKLHKYSVALKVQNEQARFLDGGFITLDVEDDYAPLLTVELHKEGEHVLFDENSELVASTRIQMKRYQSNVIHPLVLQLSPPQDKQRTFLLFCNVLIEEETDKAEPQSISTDIRKRYHQGLFSSRKADSNLLKEDSATSQQISQQTVDTIGGILEDSDVDFTHQIFAGLYDKGGVCRTRLLKDVRKMKSKSSVAFIENYPQEELDSFELMVRLCLLTKQHEKLIEYVFKYFSYSLHSISNSDLVRTVSCILGVLNIKACDLEVISYVEQYLKTPISLKLGEVTVLLGCQKMKCKARVDLTAPIRSLVYDLALSYNTTSFPLSVGGKVVLVEEMLKRRHQDHLVGRQNMLVVKYLYKGRQVEQVLEFDQQFKTIESNSSTNDSPYGEEGEVQEAVNPIRKIVAGFSKNIHLGAVSGEYISIKRVLKLLEESPLIEYAKYVTESVKLSAQITQQNQVQGVPALRLEVLVQWLLESVLEVGLHGGFRQPVEPEEVVSGVSVFLHLVHVENETWYALLGVVDLIEDNDREQASYVKVQGHGWHQLEVCSDCRRVG